jgi:hypothetical protein
MSETRILPVLCIVLVFGLLSCRSSQPQTVVVNVLRDGQSSFSPVIERRLLAFQNSQPKTKDGKLIIVQAILPTHGQFENIVGHASHLSNMKPDVIVLDSSQQTRLNPLLKRESVGAKNVCGEEADCPAFVPSWVSGEKLEASQQVLRALLAGGPR